MELCHHRWMDAPIAALDLHVGAQLDEPELSGHAVHGPWPQLWSGGAPGWDRQGWSLLGLCVPMPSVVSQWPSWLQNQGRLEHICVFNQLLWLEGTYKAATTRKGLFEYPGWRTAAVTHCVQLGKSPCVKPVLVTQEFIAVTQVQKFRRAFSSCSNHIKMQKATCCFQLP